MPSYIETKQECGHTQVWNARHVPKLGERIYCQQCDDMSKVVARPGSWFARCETGNCRWSSVRHRIETVRKNVTQHLTEHPDHVVRLQNYDQTVSVVIRVPDGHESGIGSATSGMDSAPKLPLDC